MSLEQCGIVKLPRIEDPHRGNLTFIEGGRHVEFDIRRVYYLYEVPPGESRAGHGHKTLHQLMVAVSGSFYVHLDDGKSKKTFHLEHPDEGLYICPMIWRDIDKFSRGSVCMVLASDFFDESDYYREYADFLDAVRGAR